MTPLRLTLAMLCIPGGAAASQPYSQSMAECAGLYRSAANWVDAAAVGDLMRLNSLWYAAAVAQARAEGVADAGAIMRVVMMEKTELWDARGAVFYFTQEFRDWMAYCRSFGAHLDLDLGRPE